MLLLIKYRLARKRAEAMHIRLNRVMRKAHGNAPRRLPALLLIIALLLMTVCACNTGVPSAPAQSPGISAGAAQTDAAAGSPTTPQASQQASPSQAAATDEPEPPVRKITVTFFGDAASSKGFTWYTDASSQGSDLQVTAYTKEEAVFTGAMTFSGTAAASTNSKDELVHKAVATGLESATTYYYRVGDAALDVWSEPALFTTAPTGGAFSFIDISDTQIPGWTNKELVPDTISEAMDMCENAGFMINNGDTADSNLESEWRKYLNLTQDSLSDITVMPAVGNHETSKSCFIDHYNLDTPASDTTTGAYYSVTYSNAHFVVLNTNDKSDSYVSFSPAQLEWMTADIADARSAGADWIIVVMHIGPYSTGSHVSDANAVDTRENISPLLDELGVDIVLQGHDHVYERSKPIADGAAVPAETVAEAYGGSTVTYLKSPAGPVYVTPATAGTKHYYQNTELDEDYLNLFETLSAPKIGDKNYNTLQTFMCFTIDGNRLTATAYQFSPDIGNGTPYVIDQFGILK
jgi:hypothetical protein